MFACVGEEQIKRLGIDLRQECNHKMPQITSISKEAANTSSHISPYKLLGTLSIMLVIL